MSKRDLVTIYHTLILKDICQRMKYSEEEDEDMIQYFLLSTVYIYVELKQYFWLIFAPALV